MRVFETLFFVMLKLPQNRAHLVEGDACSTIVVIRLWLMFLLFLVCCLVASGQNGIGCVDVVSCLRDMVWGWEWLE